jgi:hypothetical protein
MRVECILAALVLSGLPQVARADCRLELELMSADLRGVKLTEAQSQQLAAWVDEALKRCGMGWEASAQEYIAKARAAGGIPERDWLDEPGPNPGEKAHTAAPLR